MSFMVSFVAISCSYTVDCYDLGASFLCVFVFCVLGEVFI